MSAEFVGVKTGGNYSAKIDSWVFEVSLNRFGETFGEPELSRKHPHPTPSGGGFVHGCLEAFGAAVAFAGCCGYEHVRLNYFDFQDRVRILPLGSKLASALRDLGSWFRAFDSTENRPPLD